jgi:hypothetical protein
LVVNHFRHDEPSARSAPVTAEAERLSKRHKFGIWTSVDLFDRVRALRAAADRDAERQKHRSELLTKKFLEVKRGG